MIRTILLVTTAIIIFASCSTDFEVNSPWEDKTVIYGLLDQSDSVQYIKINKSFLGEADAYDMANISDSSNYEGLSVFIQEWNDDTNELLRTIQLTETDEVIKDTGIFAHDDNILFKTSEILLSNRNRKYVIQIDFPNSDKVVTAETKLIGSFKIERPLYIQSGPEIKINFAQTSPLRIMWKGAYYARIYYLSLYFNYLEINGNDTIFETIKYPLSPVISRRTDNDGFVEAEDLFKEIPGEDFYKYLSSAIEPASTEKRIAESLDFEFYLGSDDFFTYLQVNNASGGLSQSKPLYTNVNNGVGLFTAKYRQTIFDKHLSNDSLDSLSFGQYTDPLNFADHNGIYH